MPRKTTTQQFDLFSRPVAKTLQGPPWQELPEETRRRLTKLMVRLILDHRDRAVQREGTDHDA